jgi:hypothetical protein
MDFSIYSVASMVPPLNGLVVSCSFFVKAHSIFVERTIKMDHTFSEPRLELSLQTSNV